MHSFQLSPEVDSNKIFLVQRSELEGRLDPIMMLYKRKIRNFKFPTKNLSSLLKNNPKYGASEAGVNRQSMDEPRYIRITDIDEYGLLKDNLGKTAKILDNQYLLSNNDILIARSGATVGKAYIHKTNKDLFFYAGYMIKFVVDKSKANIDYIFYYTQLNVYKEWVNAIQRAAGQPNINAEEYKSLKIPIPPKEIQEQIVAKMDTAYTSKKEKEAEAQGLLAGIDDYLMGELGIKLPQQQENTLQNRIFIRQLSEVSGGRFDPYYYKPTFKNILECVIKSKYIATKLSDIATDIKNGVEIRTYAKDGIRYLRVTDLGKYSINSDSPRYVTIDSIPEKIRLTKNCILISRSGSLGLINVVEPHIMNAILSSHIFKVELDSSIILPDYAEAFLRSKCGQLEIFKENNGGVIPEINQSGLKNLKIPLPPLSKQTEIAEHISQIRNQAKQLQQQAKAGLEQAKTEVETIILGDDANKTYER